MFITRIQLNEKFYIRNNIWFIKFYVVIQVQLVLEIIIIISATLKCLDKY